MPLGNFKFNRFPVEMKTTIGGSFISDLLPSVGFESTGKRMGAAGFEPAT